MLDLALALTSSAHSIIATMCESRSSSFTSWGSTSLTPRGRVVISIGSRGLRLYRSSKGVYFAGGLFAGPKVKEKSLDVS